MNDLLDQLGFGKSQLTEILLIFLTKDINIRDFVFLMHRILLSMNWEFAPSVKSIRIFKNNFLFVYEHLHLSLTALKKGREVQELF